MHARTFNLLKKLSYFIVTRWNFLTHKFTFSPTLCNPKSYGDEYIYCYIYIEKKSKFAIMQETLSWSALVKTYRLNLKLHFIVFLRILKTKKNIISKTYLYLQKFNLRRTKSFPNKNFVVCLMYLNVSNVNCQTNTIDYQETRTDTLTDGSAILSRSYL